MTYEESTSLEDTTTSTEELPEDVTPLISHLTLLQIQDEEEISGRVKKRRLSGPSSKDS